MMSGTYRKQYEALSKLVAALGLSTAVAHGSFNFRFCALCSSAIGELGGSFSPVQGGSFLGRKAACLRQLAVAMGSSDSGAGATFNETFLRAARAIWNLANDGISPDFGSTIDWRVYQYLNHATGIPSNVLRDSNGDPIKDSNGEFITTTD